MLVFFFHLKTFISFIVSVFSALTLAMARKLTNELDEFEKDVMFGGYKVYEFGELTFMKSKRKKT